MLDRIPSPFYPTAAVALSLAGMFLLVGVGSSGPDGAADVPDGSVLEAERGAAASGDGSAEGIKVHGHWTIEVREPDGELVTRREFENALTPCGAALLRELTGRRVEELPVIGPWSVELFGPISSDRLGQLVILEERAGDLEVTFPESGLHAGKLVLSGEGQARDGDITEVRTQRELDSSGATIPEECSGNPHFTATGISVMRVESGQTVFVTVAISFF